MCTYPEVREGFGVSYAITFFHELTSDWVHVRLQRDFFTKTWGDGFVEKEVAPSPCLPDISPADFQGYLRDTAKVR